MDNARAYVWATAPALSALAPQLKYCTCVTASLELTILVFPAFLATQTTQDLSRNA
jgi:hypothetical protein